MVNDHPSERPTSRNVRPTHTRGSPADEQRWRCGGLASTHLQHPTKQRNNFLAHARAAFVARPSTPPNEIEPHGGGLVPVECQHSGARIIEASELGKAPGERLELST